ncbi:hypothetical protein OG689_04365 [Kitasatospora sp. NBC_00240]|uniref:hypothetical protein n=1 Tax=Kitasatospora sp. NBC_00240 TaxID=2903567 RepID=UPI00224D08C3|nr:hypothetical protein [Kitasatospora sp. NBC_00240]MCX5208535.1 hypothetical protein [Kitasatospora sp. NBC_00240]
MTGRSRRDFQGLAGGTGAEDSARARVAGDPGVLGTALAVVLAFSLAEGSWEWFSTYLGLTLLAVILSFGQVPLWTPGGRPAYVWSLAAYSLVVGLCVALALAPALQRWDWLFPMPATRQGCVESGRYESLRTQAALGDLASQDAEALAHTQQEQSHQVVVDCLAATTTRWLPVYALGTALLVGTGAWAWGRARSGRKPTGSG